MRTRPEDFQFFVDQIKNMNPDELKKKQEEAHVQNEEEYKIFRESFSKGQCYICLEKIVRCDFNKPCIHWLLRAHKRIRKKQIEQALLTRDMFQTIAFLRWIANYEARLTNVNDFEAYEERKDLIYQETIRYNDIVWTFWVKKGDINIKQGQQVNFPHYHFHMTIDGKNFISFGELHIPLSEWEIFNIYGHRGKYTDIAFRLPHGETYTDLFNNLKAEQLVSTMKASKDDSKAQFHMSTLVVAKKGKTLKGDDIADMFKEHKKTGVPLAILAKKLGGKATTFIEPANLVEPVLRTKSKSGR